MVGGKLFWTLPKEAVCCIFVGGVMEMIRNATEEVGVATPKYAPP